MKSEDILALVKAGYSKEEIASFDEQKKDPEPDPKPEPKPDPKPDPKPEEKPKDETQIDYAKLSRELMKAVAGLDTGNNPTHKSKQELADEAMLSFVK